jgi:PAS domain-containing protein
MARGREVGIKVAAAPVDESGRGSAGRRPMATILTTLSDPTRLAVLRATGLMDEPSAPTLDQLTELGALTLGLPVVAITLLDDRRQFFASHVGLAADDEHDTPLSHSLCQHVVHTGTPLVVEDAIRDPVLAENGAVRVLGVRAYAGLPLVVDGQVLGSFCSLDTAPRSWTTHELSVLTRLAALAADFLALQVGRTGEPVGEALDASVLRRLPDTAVLRFDLDLRLTLAEGPALRRRDRGGQGLVGRLIGEVLPGDASSGWAPWYDAVAAGDYVSFDHATPTGAVWWCQGAPLLDDARRPTGGTVVIRDVTEQREHERVLEEREAQYRLLAERSTDVISRHDPTGRYLYASPARARSTGTTPYRSSGAVPRS